MTSAATSVDTATIDGNPAVQVDGLVKRYRDRTVVDGLSFTVGRGEVFALLGPNGAGKTTTIEILEGLRTADAGWARVLGLDPGRDGKTLRPRVGVMLQDGGAPPGLRAREVLGLCAALYRDPEPPDRMLGLVGLADHAGSLVRNLSGGEKQRLSLGMALVGRPELVFLDEPTVGMDAAARRRTWRTIRELAARGVTVMLTTHYLEEAESLADRVAIVDEGKLLALDTPDQLTALTTTRVLWFTTDRSIAADELAGAIGHPIVATEGSYRVDTEPTPELLATLTRRLAELGVLITELHHGRVSLEDVFLRLTRDGDDV